MKKLILSLLFLPPSCYAGIITHNDYVSGNTITAAGQNANENTIINDYNGNIQGTTANSGGTATNILQGSISTPDLRANAITQTLNTNTDSFSGIGGTFNHNAASQSITTIGGQVLIIGTAVVQCGGVGSLCAAVFGGNTRVLSGSESCCACVNNGTLCGPTVIATEQLAAGTTTYNVLYTQPNSTTFLGGSINVIELRR